MSDVRINTRSPYYIEANPTEPTQPTIPTPVENNTPPTVTITVSNENPYVGETVTLTAVATDSDGTIVGYQWGGFSTATTQSITATNSTLIQSQIFTVTVTDNDGDTATAIKAINWQEIPEPTENSDRDVNCGDTVNEATFVGLKTYNLIGVGNKVGNVQIEFLDGGGNQESPVIFNINWNGSTVTTGYVGDSNFLTQGITLAQDNRTSPTNKNQPTTLTINKTAASPTEVTLTAFSPLANDSYSFKLNCPNVEVATTFFHTLTGTCSSGNTTFTYTDVNGATQNEILANGATKVVSAQANTVTAAVCTGTVEQGGQSFDLGTPELKVNSTSEFTLWLDMSGSLNDEADQLKVMMDNQLKNSFLTYYNNDSVAYNSRVNNKEVNHRTRGIINGSIEYINERFLSWGTTDKTSTGSQIVHLIYVDEAHPIYHTGNVGENTIYANYTTDLTALRNSLNAQASYGDKLIVVFCIEKNYNNFYSQFSHFITNVSTGVNGYDGSNGLSDRSDVVFVRNVLPKQNADYYHQKTIDALTSLGFKI